MKSNCGEQSSHVYANQSSPINQGVHNLPQGFSHTFSNIISNVGSARAISIPMSLPTSDQRISSSQNFKDQSAQNSNHYNHYAERENFYQKSFDIQQKDEGFNNTDYQTENYVNDFKIIDPYKSQIQNTSQMNKGILNQNSLNKFSQIYENANQDQIQSKNENIPLQLSNQETEASKLNSNQKLGAFAHGQRSNSLSSGNAGFTQTMASPFINQQGPTPLVKQLSDKISMQAERLQVMEAYKALCERRILDFDPNHQLPVMPYHLGNTANFNDENLQNNTNADFKRLLALKEQDLQYSNQRNEKLVREIEELRNSNKNVGNQGNFEALRKEIELNEKLQRQVEMLQEQIQKLQNQESQNKKNASPQRSLKSHRSDNENISMTLQMKKLKEQLESLNDEKNALLDYIEENIDKSIQQKENNQFTDEFKSIQSQNQILHSQNKDLLTNLESTQKQNQQFKLQIEQMNKIINQNSNIFGSQNINLQDQIKQNDNMAENTFGLDQINNLIENKNDLEKDKKLDLKEDEQMLQKYKKIEVENEQLKDKIRIIMHMDSQEGNMSSRTQRSGTDKISERAYSSSKQIIKELEGKLKATQENSKTLSLTLNETQAELDQLNKDHQQMSKEFKVQLEENQKLYQHLHNNQQYLENLQKEKNSLEVENQKFKNLVNKYEEELKQFKELKGKDKERIERLENHIRELKEEQQKNVNQASEKWEETINELTKDLENTKVQVQKRQEMFSQMEKEYQGKIQFYENGGKYEKNNLEKRVEDLQQEVKQLLQQKHEKDQKLRNQIHKNEELLGELQELSEAVNLLKNDRELTMRSEVIVQKQNIIEEYSNFISIIQKKSFDKIFSSLLKFTDYIREFYKNHKLQPFDLEQQFLINKVSKQDKEDMNQVFPMLIFDQIDRNLKSVAEMQIEWQKNQYGIVKNSESENEMNQSLKVEKDLKIMNNFLKDLEQLSSNLLKWNQGVIENYKIKIQQLNESQKNLENYQNETVNLKDQLKRINQEETQIVERDRQLDSELRQLNMTLQQKEKQMEDQYKREDKLGRQNQKLKVQLDNCLKEYGSITKHVHKIIKEKDEYEKQNQEQNIQIVRLNEQISNVEYQLNGMSEQVYHVNQMIEVLQKAMPSDELENLLKEMQSHIQATYQLNQKFTFTESQLLQMENQFKILANSDTSISQNVIQLRKNIDLQRREIKNLQLQKIELQNNNKFIIENLRNVEQIEKRRNDVALETEKSLADSKQQIQEMKRELLFANNSRRDLELTIYSIKQQNEILERELMQLRIQASQSQFDNKTATLGNVFAKMRQSKSLGTFSQDSALQRIQINNHNPLQGVMLEDTPTGQNSSQKHLTNTQVNNFNFDNQQLQNQFMQRAQSQQNFNQNQKQIVQYPEYTLNNNTNRQETDIYSQHQQKEQNEEYQRQEQYQQMEKMINEYPKNEKQNLRVLESRNEHSSRQNDYTFSPLRQRSMSAGLNRPIIQNNSQNAQINKIAKLQAASTSNLQKNNSISIYKTQIYRQQPEQLIDQNQFNNQIDLQMRINSENVSPDKKLHNQGVLQMESHQSAKLPPFHPKATQYSKQNQSSKSDIFQKRIYINQNYQQNDKDHEQRPQSLIENLNYQQSDFNQQHPIQLSKIQRSQSAYQKDYGTFGDQIQSIEYQRNNESMIEYPQQNGMDKIKFRNEQQKSGSSNIIMNYPSMQNIHTSQSNNNEFHTVDENSNNLFSFPASTNSQNKGQPIYIQNETSRDENNDFQVDVNLKYSNNKYVFNMPTNKQSILVTPSLTTNKTEFAKQGLQIEHAKQSESKQSGTIQSMQEEQYLFEKQKENNLNQMNFSNIHRQMNSFDSDQIEGVALSDVDNNNEQSNDFVVGYDKDNSLIQSNLDQSESSFKDQANSQKEQFEELAYKKSDLQRKLSQVKNVFSSIRQNLNEASTVQDPTSSSQN